jgi:hypothetical protein
MDIQVNITGRDGYIIQKALAYAVAVIPWLPQEYQESSDRDDMLDLLRATNKPENLKMILAGVAETVSHIEDPFRK